MKKIQIWMIMAVIPIAAYCQNKYNDGMLHISSSEIVPIPKEIDFKEVAKVWELLDSIPYDDMKESQRNIIDLCEHSDALMHFYSPACSWYCGGIVDTIISSSCQKADKYGSYEGIKAHDWDINSAWVTNSRKYGVGESVTYTFPGNCPRLTTIIVLNGYTRDINEWQDYSRVKKLKLYYDEKPYAILELHDTRDEQNFKVGLLGFRDVEHPQKWTLRFEILEVYPGRKHRNTAITELYFDGVDVH